MQRVHLAEGGAHLPHLHEELAGQFRQGHVPLLERHALLTERQEEIAARVRIDHRLERGLGFGHLERRAWIHRVVPAGAEEISDDSHVGIEDLGVGRPASGDGRGLGHRHRGGGAQRRELRFERGDSGTEVLSQLLDLLFDRLGLFGTLRLGRAGGAGEQPANERRARDQSCAHT